MRKSDITYARRFLIYEKCTFLHVLTTSLNTKGGETWSKDQIVLLYLGICTNYHHASKDDEKPKFIF